MHRQWSYFRFVHLMSACIFRASYSTDKVDLSDQYISERDHLTCYVQRYHDLLMRYCSGSLAACDWDGLQLHYSVEGRREGREFYCTHVVQCTRANLNILNLISGEVPYNICRNLEWQVCAANGKLPGQGGRTIQFSFAPKYMDGNAQNHNLGHCGGWHPKQLPTGGFFGFTNDDIYFMEVCLFNSICTNTDDLFRLGPGEDFVCDFSPTGFEELQTLLLTPSKTPLPSLRCTMTGPKRFTGVYP